MNHQATKHGLEWDLQICGTNFVTLYHGAVVLRGMGYDGIP